MCIRDSSVGLKLPFATQLTLGLGNLNSSAVLAQSPTSYPDAPAANRVSVFEMPVKEEESKETAGKSRITGNNGSTGAPLDATAVKSGSKYPVENITPSLPSL